MNARTGFAIALLVGVVGGFCLTMHFLHSDSASINTNTNLNAPSVNASKVYRQTIDGAFTVSQFQDKAYRFSVPDGAEGATLKGHFAATGGTNDIEVSLMDNNSYANREDRHPANLIYASGRVTQGTLNVTLPQPGMYYLVFDNRFSGVAPKAVEDNLSLTYKR
jgi:hypothetical protein